MFQSTLDFPEACRALLDQVLTAGLLADKSQSVRLVDVGCGCGDQSLYLTSLPQNSPTAIDALGSGFEATPTSDSTPHSRFHQEATSRLIDTYIGITLEPAQATLAQKRLQNAQHVAQQMLPVPQAGRES